MKRLVFIMSAVIAAATISSSCGNNKNASEKVEQQGTEQVAAEATDTSRTEIKQEEIKMEMVKLEQPEFDIVTTHGTMRIKLYDKTPKHRDNFVKLVSEKFYDNIRFHRIIAGFMIQTGDPYSKDMASQDKWGTGGPDYTIPAEFVSEYTHKKGAIAAARRGDMANPTKASSGSQFYIVHSEQACQPLNGDYTVFGEVINGLEVIDKIANVTTDLYDRPKNDVRILKIKPVEAASGKQQ